MLICIPFVSMHVHVLHVSAVAAKMFSLRTLPRNQRAQLKMNIAELNAGLNLKGILVSQSSE